MNIFEEEIVEFIRLMHKHRVYFILVGGIAVNYYGYSRTTGDIDIWLEDTPENRKQLVETLKEYEIEGAEAFLTYPLVAGYAEILLAEGIYIDFMADLVGLKQKDFEECYKMAEEFMLEEKIPVKVLRINTLIEEKMKSKRDKDLDDAAQLKKLKNKKN